MNFWITLIVNWGTRQTNGCSRSDLIKIDVEGAEQNALEGMRKTIKNYNPTFIIEVLPNKELEKFLQEFFLSYGYVWYWLTTDGPVKKEFIEGDATLNFSNWLFTKKSLPSAYQSQN